MFDDILYHRPIFSLPGAVLLSFLSLDDNEIK